VAGTNYFNQQAALEASSYKSGSYLFHHVCLFDMRRSLARESSMLWSLLQREHRTSKHRMQYTKYRRSEEKEKFLLQIGYRWPRYGRLFQHHVSRVIAFF